MGQYGKSNFWLNVREIFGMVMYIASKNFSQGKLYKPVYWGFVKLDQVRAAKVFPEGIVVCCMKST